jgi:hypothetical protein
MDEHYVTILKVGTEWVLKTRGNNIMTLEPFIEAGKVKYFDCLPADVCPEPKFDVRSYDDYGMIESIYGPNGVKYFYTGQDTA